MSVAAEAATTRGTAPPESGTEFRQVGRRASVYLIASALQAALAAITVPIAAHFLSPGQYGVAALVMIMSLLFNTFAMAGFPTAAMRLFFDPKVGASQARTLYGPALVVAATMGALAAGFLLVLHAVTSLGAFWPGIMVIPALTIPNSLGALSASLLQAEKRARAFAIVAIMRGGLNTGMGIVFVVAFSSSASTYLLGYALGSMMIGSTGIALARPRLKFASRALVRRATAIGAPTIAAAVGVFALALADRFVVQIARSGPDVGRYQLAYAVGGIVFRILVAINYAWLQQVLGAKGAQGRTDAIREVGTVMQAASMAFIAGIALLSPLVLPAILSHSYHPQQMATLAAVVALGAVTYVPYVASNQLILWHERTIVLAWITPTAVVVELIAGFILVGPFGLLGVAVASGIAYIFQAGCVTWRTARIANLDWLSGAWIAASIPGLVAWVLGLVLPSTGIGVVLRLICLAALLATCVRAAWLKIQPGTSAVAASAEPA